jgi:phytoene dehydrogenase-like protein
VTGRPAFAERVLDRLEAHAPGLRERVVDTTVVPPAALEQRDPNLVGGDVGGGSAAPDQLVVFRPWRVVAVRAAGARAVDVRRGVHPGGGVHGLCGRNAARAVLRTARLRPWAS